MAKGHRRVYIARIRGANDSLGKTILITMRCDMTARAPI